MTTLPEGQVTFLFTDIEGSTRAWERSPEAMSAAMKQHDSAVQSAVESNGGMPVKARGEGDSWFIVFAHASDAVGGAAEIQRRLAVIDWDTEEPLAVRASIHSGSADLRLGDYYGPTVNRAARLRGIAHGGQTVLSRSTYELVQDSLPPGVSIVDMGEHRLKDLTRPEYVYQLNVDGLPTDFPALLSLNSIENNLPVQLTEFVGREAERGEVASQVREARLVTILASGGSGKTRLAIQVAADLAHEFPDGVFFIPLADISSGADIVQTVTESLGIGLSSDEDHRSQLLSYLAGKRQLLVFDNFEHLTDEASLVSDILKSAPAISVLATSRSKLSITGETVFNLSGFETDWDSDEAAFDTAAVQLFVDSARRVDAGFMLGADDLGSVQAILRSTGGLPLAILLAAAWVDMLSVPEISAEIDKSLDFLETEMGDVPDRHRSIRAVFEYSWAMLAEDERTTFTSLSVFKGGFTRDAAQHVAGASLRGLANLASKSLVTADPTAGRYSIHALLRQYAEAELKSDAERCSEVELAHAVYFANLMDSMQPLMVKSDQGLLLRTVETDIDNIRAAWHHYLELGDGANTLRFISVLYLVYELRGWYPAAIELFDEAMVRFENVPEPECVAAYQTARGAKAWFLTLTGQVERGTEEADAALAALPDSIDPIDRWLVIQASAIGNAYLGRPDEMSESLNADYALYASLDDQVWARGIDNWRSFALILEGRFQEATETLSGTMEHYVATDEHYFMTWALWLQALTANHEGRIEDAIELYRRQGDRSREIGYLRGQVESYSGLGDATAVIGRHPEAMVAYVDALRISEQMGMVPDMFGLLSKIAGVQFAMGNGEDAVELLTLVIDDPMSTRHPFSINVPIRDAATEVLESIRPTMDAGAFRSAEDAGRVATFDAVVNTYLGRST